MSEIPEVSAIFLGATFKSFEEFNIALKEYCAKTHQKFVIASCKKSTNREQHTTPRFPPLPVSCIYTYLHYRCVKEGVHRTVSKGVRNKPWVISIIAVIDKAWRLSRELAMCL
jgi:hypothetical protein